MITIATIITCHNRKDKTVSCISGLLKARDIFNTSSDDKIDLSLYITDDGCTDGTADALLEICKDEKLFIIQGSGNEFWAGGMRLAWRAAMESGEKWDFYLLLNDDTDVYPTVFGELLATHQYSIEKTGKSGLYSGITCSKEEPKRLTYGGDVWVNRFLGTMRRLDKSNLPQRCDMTNANILLVPSEVVDKIGIFYDKYQHDVADSDYSHTANKKGIPVWVTANYCGECDDDHPDRAEQARKVCNMSFKERKKYFANPVHSSKDYLIYRSRVTPLRLPLVWLGRMMNLYCPKFYYYFDKAR